MQEVWLPVVGWEDLYAVSDLGRVKSLTRTVDCKDGRRRTFQGQALAATKGTVYLEVSLARNGKGKTTGIHRLVAEAFLGPPPAGKVVRHGPGGQLDNRLCNLCYGTLAENQADRLRDGTSNRGERHGHSKLTEEQVLEARRLVASGPKGTLFALARSWGVTRSALGAAVRGQSWGWL